MCGIAGGIHSGLSRQAVTQVIQRLAHRGPDDSGLWMEGKVWLANTRLAIRDLSHRGHQPMQTPDGRFTLVFNGEIYNHLSLRKQLEAKGKTFISSCDTETLLQAYAFWEADCLDMLEGDFAFAVHDAASREVFIARDPIGVKPLYYYQDDRQFLFASELKALTGLPSLDYTLQPEVFPLYLLFQYGPTTDTPFRYIKKLLPGHYIKMSISSKKSLDIQRYYSAPFTGRHQQHTRKEWVQKTEETLGTAISSRLQSDAPLGLTLSGGLDSSLVAAIVRKIRPEQELHAFCINTQGTMRSEGFEDDFSCAQIVAEQQRIRLHEVSGVLNIAEELEGLIYQLDEPQADPAALHMLHISAAARDMGIKVLLSGTGGDDIFSGYRRHQAIPYLKMLPAIGSLVHRLSSGLSKAFPSNATLRRITKGSASAGLSLEDAMIYTHFWASPSGVQKLFRPEISSFQDGIDPYALFHDLLKEIPNETSALNKMLFWELRSFLPHHNLAYMDKLSMAHSVEVRVPFTNKELISLSTEMPPFLKLRGNITKAILRAVAKPYLPASIINRKKTGFGAPLRSWIRTEGHVMVRERLLDDSFLRRGIFNRIAVEQLIDNNQWGRIDGAYTLFSLLSIESWLRQFTPSA